jgi:hypothetical protein
MCFGADIDMRVLRGWSVGRSTSESPGDIFTNFGVYGLTPPEIIRNDVSHLEVYRAIRCSHLRPSLWNPGRVCKKTLSSENSTEIYESRDVIMDLAAWVLRKGGRLVYLLPTDREQQQ